MGKPLSAMTKEELWRLFPISLAEHRDCWADWYAAASAELTPPLDRVCDVYRLSHIGSTSVTGLWAKDIVDILLEISPRSDWAEVKKTLLSAGYLCMSEEPDRASFNRGYTENGFVPPVYHLHLRRGGDCDELYFRDYLREHADVAAAYEALKLSLWKQYEYDRDGYTEAKTEFIRTHTKLAKQAFGTRYSFPGQ